MNLTENVHKIIQLSKSKIGKDSAIVLTGNILGAGLGSIATILITRTLGPAQFGLFSVALAVMMIASQFSDFGIGTGLVRFASSYLKDDNQKANLMFKVSLKLKLIIATLVFLIGFFASESLAVHVFGKPELIFLLKLAFIGAFGASLVAYITATLQARQSFKKFTLVNIINHLGKLTLIGLLFLTYRLNLLSALTTVIILPFIAFLIGSLIIPKDFLRAKGNEKEAFHELFRFTKWILVSTFCVMIFDRLDILMLSYFKTADIVGQYSAAFNLAHIIPLLTISIVTILFPSFSKLSGDEEIKQYMKKSLKFIIPLGLLLLIIFLFVGELLILFLYGDAYKPSVIVFKIIVFAFILGLISKPFSLTFYALNKPEIITFIVIIELFFNFFLNYLLIPTHAAVGAAIATLSVRIVGIILFSFFVYTKVIRNKKRS